MNNADFDAVFTTDASKQLETLAFIGIAALYLESAARVKNAEHALDLFYEIRDAGIIPIQLTYLGAALQFDLTRDYAATMQKTSPDLKERDLQSHFFLALDQYIPGATKAKVPHKKGAIPDGFVLIEGNLSPVEVKATTFNERALAQLMGYMARYEMGHGIAVAQECTAELPANVTFIKVDSCDLPKKEEAYL